MAQSSANGALLYLGSLGSPQTFTEVAYQGDHGGFGVSNSDIDTSVHNDASGFTDSVPGLKDPGTWTGKLFWDPANATQNGTAGTGMFALSKTGVTRDWKVTDYRNSTSYFFFQGYVKEIKFSKGVNAAQMADVVIKLRGALHHTSES